MPIKVFEKHAAEAGPSFEKRVNEWLAKIDDGAIKNISTAAAQSGMSIVLTVWYEGLPPPN
jgi:hypothetical protein